MKLNSVITILILLSSGFIFRLWLGSQATNKLVYDSMFYSSMASAMSVGHHEANCCNIGPGYPLFIAAVYKLFGVDNLVALKYFQALLDTFSGFFIYIVARRYLNAKAAFLGLVLYMTNPLTASYTGSVLTEILAIFIITAISLLITGKHFSRRIWQWILFGVIAGYLVLVKMSFYQFNILLWPAVVFFVVKKRKLLFITLAGSGFILAVLYAVIVNYLTFGKVSIIPPYRTFLGPLYVSVGMNRAGELAGEPVKVTEEFSKYMEDYYNYYLSDPKQLISHDMTYKDKLLNRLKDKWPAYIGHFITNNIWMWDKYHLFIYYDIFYPGDIWIIRILNIIYLSLHFAGIYFFLRSGKKPYLKSIFVYTLILFIYVSGVYPMFNSETRLSMPYYPFIFLWAGYGMYKTVKSSWSAVRRKR